MKKILGWTILALLAGALLLLTLTVCGWPWGLILWLVAAAAAWLICLAVDWVMP